MPSTGNNRTTGISEITTKWTWQPSSAMSAFGGEADMDLTGRHFRF
jgi:hypothetical protein